MVTAVPDPEQYPSDTDRLNLPPQSVQAEQALLGGLMLDTSAWDRVADRVTEVDFYRQDHRLIFTAIRAAVGAQSALRCGHAVRVPRVERRAHRCGRARLSR